jgi:hypothetical protein
MVARVQIFLMIQIASLNPTATFLQLFVILGKIADQ